MATCPNATVGCWGLPPALRECQIQPEQLGQGSSASSVDVLPGAEHSPGGWMSGPKYLWGPDMLWT